MQIIRQVRRRITFYMHFSLLYLYKSMMDRKDRNKSDFMSVQCILLPSYLNVHQLFFKLIGERLMYNGKCFLNEFYSILFYPIILEGRRGTTDEFAIIPLHLVLFSAAIVELAKSIPVHSLILSSYLFFCLPLFLFPFTVPCRIIFAKPEDLETWPNHLSFRFLTRVRSSS